MGQFNESTIDSKDISEIKKLYNKDECAKAILDHASSRTKNSSKTSVDRLTWKISRNGANFSRRDVIDVLKQLENFNCGKFVVGRRGAPSRFEWDVEMIGLGNAARGMETKIVRLNEGEKHTDDHDEEEDVPPMIEHRYTLRPDLPVTLSLPANLTEKEAARLSEFIKTLPFGSSDSL